MLAAWALVVSVGGLVAGVWLGRAEAQFDVEDGDVARGEALYTQHCVQCHSPDGSGGRTPAGLPAPAIDGVSVSYARLVLVTHRMPPGEDPFDNRERPRVLDDQQQADVLAYLVERFDLQGELSAPPPGDASRGLALYAQNCAQCHGATGAGGVAGAGAWTPTINQYPPAVIADAVRVGPFEMPRFSEATLSDQDVGDIAAFLQEVDEEPGTLLFPGELNPVFASGFGALLTVAVVALAVVIAGRPYWLPDEEDPEAVVDDGEEVR